MRAIAPRTARQWIGRLTVYTPYTHIHRMNHTLYCPVLYIYAIGHKHQCSPEWPLKNTRLRFQVGDHVECCVGYEMVWMKGTVENVDYYAEEAETGRKKRVAYYVKLDYGFEDSYISAEFDICDLIRKAGPEPLPPRFPVGEKVECCMGVEFMRGAVVKHHYTESHSDGSIVRAPYQVRLDSGGLIYARFDNDMCIRKACRVSVDRTGDRGNRGNRGDRGDRGDKGDRGDILNDVSSILSLSYQPPPVPGVGYGPTSPSPTGLTSSTSPMGGPITPVKPSAMMQHQPGMVSMMRTQSPSHGSFYPTVQTYNNNPNLQHPVGMMGGTMGGSMGGSVYGGGGPNNSSNGGIYGGGGSNSSNSSVMRGGNTNPRASAVPLKPPKPKNRDQSNDPFSKLDVFNS